MQTLQQCAALTAMQTIYRNYQNWHGPLFGHHYNILIDTTPQQLLSTMHVAAASRKIKLRCGVRCQYSVPNSITFMLDACAHFVIYVVYGCQVHIARKCNCHKLHGHRHTHTDTHSASSDAMPNCRNCASSTDPRRTMANQTSCLCMSVSYLCTMFNSAAG